MFSGDSIRDTFFRFRYHLRNRIGHFPSVYFPLYNLIHPRTPHCTSRKSDIVIEGFPRSANSFAVTAFAMVQKKPMRIAHHRHLPAQIIAAVKYCVPAIVLVRNPKDAVSSFLAYNRYLRIDEALRGYVYFYDTIDSYRDHFVVAPFDVVVSEFDRVIRKVNEVFTTSFEEFVPTEENMKKCREMIKKYYRERVDSKEYESQVAVPSQAREKLKSVFLEDFSSSQILSIRSQAEDIYSKFISYSLFDN